MGSGEKKKKGKARKAVRQALTGVEEGKWDPRWIGGWIALAITVFVFEMWSLLDGNEATPPLTQVTVKWVPAAIIMAFIGWLAVHFGRRYLDK